MVSLRGDNVLTVNLNNVLVVSHHQVGNILSIVVRQGRVSIGYHFCRLIEQISVSEFVCVGGSLIGVSCHSVTPLWLIGALTYGYVFVRQGEVVQISKCPDLYLELAAAKHAKLIKTEGVLKILNPIGKHLDCPTGVFIVSDVVGCHCQSLLV